MLTNEPSLLADADVAPSNGALSNCALAGFAVPDCRSITGFG